MSETVFSKAASLSDSNVSIIAMDETTEAGFHGEVGFVFDSEESIVDHAHMFLHQDLDEAVGNAPANLDDVNASFDEVLDDISTIAADLMRFNSADSIEIDSVDSRRSSKTTDSEHDLQAYSAENVCGSTDQSLGAILLELEDIAKDKPCNDDPFCSPDSSSTPARLNVLIQRASAGSLTTLGTITEDDSGEPSYPWDGSPGLSGVDNAEVFGTPLASGTSIHRVGITGARNEFGGLKDGETFATSTPKKDSSSGSPTALRAALGTPLAFADSASDLDSPRAVSPVLSTRPPARSMIPNAPRFLPFSDPRTQLDATDIERIRPSLDRSPLGNIHTAALSNGVPQAPRPVRHGHTRTSSRDKSENLRRVSVAATTRSARPVPPRARLSLIR